MRKRQEVIYGKVIRSCDHKEAVMAARDLTQQIIVKLVTVPTKELLRPFLPVPNVKVTRMGVNKARGKFANVFCGTMMAMNDGTLLGDEDTVVFKEFVNNKRCDSKSSEVTSHFLNELNLLRFLKDKKDSDRLGSLKKLVRTTGGVLYTMLPNYDVGNLKGVLTLNLHKQAQVAKTWLEDLWSIGAQLRGLQIVHRDIRPRNICVKKEGTAEKPTFRLILTDWKFGSSRCKKHLGQDGDVLLCLREDDTYQPPEVCLARVAPVPDHEHDVWGLALIMEQILAMKPCLFDSESWNDDGLMHIDEIFVTMLDVPKDTLSFPDGVRERMRVVTKERHRKPKVLAQLGKRRISRDPPLATWVILFTDDFFQKVFKWDAKYRRTMCGNKFGTRQHLSILNKAGKKKPTKATKKKKRKKRKGNKKVQI